MDPNPLNRPSSGNQDPPLDPETGAELGEPGASAAHQERVVESAQGSAAFGARVDSGAPPTGSGKGPGDGASRGSSGDDRRSGPGSASGGAGHGAGETDDAFAERARELAERLKPMAMAAEEAAVKAVDLSTKGLNRLSAYLEKRRQERHATPPAAERADDI